MHDHAHGHHHHQVLTGTFMVAEVAGGLITGSLALLADAGHMLTDTVALALAWVAFVLTERPADHKRTFGYHRWPVLAAFVNGLALLGIVLWIAVEAVQRMLDPQPVLGGTMLVIAFAGLVVNIVAFALLHGGDRDNLNLRGAALHVLGDLLGSAAAIIAAGVIMTTGWTPIDPLLSLFVALLLVRSAWYLLRQSGHVLLEGALMDRPAHGRSRTPRGGRRRVRRASCSRLVTVAGTSDDELARTRDRRGRSRSRG